MEQILKNIYQDQWPQIKIDLARPNPYMYFSFSEFLNLCPLPTSSMQESEIETPISFEKLINLNQQFFLHGKWNDQGDLFYFLDPASYYPVKYLAPFLFDRNRKNNVYADFKTSEIKFLDLCSAPGGKSLLFITLMKMFCEQFQLSFSEMSFCFNEENLKRFVRLKKNIENFLKNYQQSNIIFRDQFQFSHYDGRILFRKFPNSFSHILVDVPCSSERHYIHQEGKLPLMKNAKRRDLTNTQLSLLCSAHLMLNKGGQMVYSTCSLDPLQNDQVVERFMQKNGLEYQLANISLSDMESKFVKKTQNGYLIIPNAENYFMGPIYFSVLTRKNV